MAWIYLAESGAYPSPYRPGLDRLPIVNRIDTLKPSCSQECEMGHFTEHQSGTTCKHLKAVIFQKSISSTEGSHARTSALQDLAQGWKESVADYSSRLCGWPKRSDPHLYFLRTSQRSRPADSPKLEKKFPPSAMIVDGILYPLKKWARLTFEKDGFSWPTPNVSDSLSVNWKDDHDLKRGYLRAVVHYPTPRVCNGKRSSGMNRSEFYKLWTTPVADDTSHRKQRYKQGGTALSTQIGGALNPMWVEWLMGYPLGWTGLGDLETAWFQDKREKRLNV